MLRQITFISHIIIITVHCTHLNLCSHAKEKERDRQPEKVIYYQVLVDQRDAPHVVRKILFFKILFFKLCLCVSIIHASHRFLQMTRSGIHYFYILVSLSSYAEDAT